VVPPSGVRCGLSLGLHGILTVVGFAKGSFNESSILFLVQSFRVSCCCLPCSYFSVFHLFSLFVRIKYVPQHSDLVPMPFFMGYLGSYHFTVTA